MLCLTILQLLIVSSYAANYSFVTLGDWGGAALGGQDYDNVYAVANQMAASASQLQSQFIINTGDNFYWCGIKNTSDFQIRVDYEEPYAAQSLQTKWYSVLGNHEYGYNVQAQLDYSKINTNWVMPDRYYTERIELASGVYMSMIFIDSSPCVLDYREDNPKYWDPCSTQYPTCSMGSTDDDFEGPCQFHENILGQDCGMQYYWFQTMLAAVPADDWLVVVGHHPIDELDYADFTTLLQNRGFSIYLNGHTHTLNRYTIDNAGIYITSGAGALVDTVDQSHPVTSAKVRGENLKTKLYKSTPSVGAEVKYNSHTYKTIYNNKVAGFTTHTFNEDFTVLTTNFVTYTGDIVYSFTSNKKGQELSSSL